MTRLCNLTTSGWLLAILLAAFFMPGIASAQWDTDWFDGPDEPWTMEESVEQGQDALQSRSGFPWYDSDADGLRSVPVYSPQAQARHRDSDWERQQNTTTATNNWNWFSPTMGAFFQWIAWVLLGLAIAALIGGLIWAFAKSDTGLANDGSDRWEDQRAHEQAVIESLPFAIERPQSDLLGEAKRHYEDGNFREAIIYLFSYQLVQLDRHHVIRLTKGKTNRQYLRETGRRATLKGALERTMLAFEDVFFGNHDIDRETFEVCWRELPAFEGDLEQATS